MDAELEKKRALERFLVGKRALKLELIKLPFAEKIRRVIEMQKLERLLKRDPARKIHVWKL